MQEEKIIQTIRKVLELSKNNPSEEEAKSAALKAQELLAKYHIDMKEVESIDIDTIEIFWFFDLHVYCISALCFGRATATSYNHKC